MPDEITRELFDHLVALAELELNDEEAEYIRRELNEQLTSIHELEAIEVDNNVPITSHGVPYTQSIRPPLRQDKPDKFARVDEIIEQAPEVDQRFIVVPEIPHTELE